MKRDLSSSGRIAGRLPAGAVFRAFLALGLTSFGGPVAHIGYFREAFVVRRAWMDERGYADLVALCQMLPGPTSSQVGIGIGLTKAGLAGAFAAWLGFTAPSAVALVALGYGVVAFGDAIPAGLLRGLEAVVVAVVAQALWGMARTLCPDPPRVTVAVLGAAAVLGIGGSPVQVAVIVAGGLAGLLLLRVEDLSPPVPARTAPVPGIATASIVIFFVLLALLPVLAAILPSQGLALADSFYRSGSLVFGGGHVVLPLLEAEVLPPGWVSEDAFLAGYGAAQAVPGPLFTFAAYLGTVMETPPRGMGGGADLPVRHLRAVLPAGRRHAAVLERATPPGGGPPRDARRQRRRRRPPARGPLRSGVDERGALGGRFRPRPRRVRPARLLEAAALAGGDPRRPCGMGGGGAGRVAAGPQSRAASFQGRGTMRVGTRERLSTLFATPPRKVWLSPFSCAPITMRSHPSLTEVLRISSAG